MPEGPAVRASPIPPSGSWLLGSRVSTCDHCPVWAQVWQAVPEDPVPGQLIRGGGLHGGQAGVAGHSSLLHQHHDGALRQPVVSKHIRARIQELVGKPGNEGPENGSVSFAGLLVPGGGCELLPVHRNNVV